MDLPDRNTEITEETVGFEEWVTILVMGQIEDVECTCICCNNTNVE